MAFCFPNIREQSGCSVFLTNISHTKELSQCYASVRLFCFTDIIQTKELSQWSVSLSVINQPKESEESSQVCFQREWSLSRNRHRCAFKGSDPCLGIVTGVLSKRMIPVCPAGPQGPWLVSTRSVPAKTRQTAASSRKNRVELRSAALPLPRVEKGKPAAPSQVNPTADGASSSTRSSELSKPDWRKGGVHIITNVYKILL